MHPTARTLIVLASSFLLVTAQAREQVALVIGNSAYEGDAKLDNPANDATAVARELRQLNFTTVIEVIDGDRERMEEGLGQFLDALGPDKLGFFYYAGHGVQIDGANYLLPVGTVFERAYDVKYKSLSLNQIMDAINEAGSLPNAVVLDCCRNNPFRGLNPGRSVRGQGLAEVPNQQGTLVAFSTAAGATAADQDQVLKDHSPYTTALLMELRGPSAGHYEIASLFRSVAQKVHQSTGQDPLLRVPGSVGNYDLKAAEFIGKMTGAGAGSGADPALSQSEAMERIKMLELQGEAKTDEMKALLAQMNAKMAELEKRANEPKVVVMQDPNLAAAPMTPDPSFAPQPLPSRSAPVYTSPWLFPDSDSRYLTGAEIQALSAEERWVARNEIFARRGYIFTTARGQSYAQRLGQAYQGVVRDQDALFDRMNSYERSNIELIKSYE